MLFSELGLSPKVLAAIEAAGYTVPTPIQEQAIPIALSGRDVLGIAQTGTGKTASFVLPMLTRLETGRARARMPRSLILAPTRELAAQVAENFERYGANHKLTLALIIGGVSFDDQLRKLSRGVDVLIATPGRLLDHFTRGKLLLTGVEILVIDEADRMLDMGFIPDIERICSLLPPSRQTLFFSATMPKEIQRLVERFLKDPEKVEVTPQASAAPSITQRFRFTSWDAKQKREVLRDWIKTEEVKNAIIFCNRKKDVDILYKSLMKHGLNAGCLHGDMDQMSRTSTLDRFRAGEVALLCASDVAARGLDIPDVSHVFNYDVPIVAEDYIHRIGRTGRAGKKGFSATLVTDDDMRTVREIEKMLKGPLEWVGDPPPEDAGSKTGRRSRSSPLGEGLERRGGRERGGRGGRGRSGSGPERGNRPEAPIERMPAAAMPAELPVAAAAEQPAADRPRRHESRPPRQREPRPAGPSTEAATLERERPPRQRDNERGKPSSRREHQPREDNRNREESGAKVVGLGDHMPDFLKRTVRSGNGEK